MSVEEGHHAMPNEVAGAPGYGVTLDRIARDLDAVEVAMRRLDDFTYGLCERCGAMIGEDELERNPLAATCAEHAAR
jgi:DnaK suppressor protein